MRIFLIFHRTSNCGKVVLCCNIMDYKNNIRSYERNGRFMVSENALYYDV